MFSYVKQFLIISRKKVMTICVKSKNDYLPLRKESDHMYASQ